MILLVHSPAYFVSKWCRWELELAEKLAAEPANSGGSLKLIYLILSRYYERLDLSDEGERLLFVDLTNVRERAEKLSFALQSVSPKAKELRFTLGRRSLQDLLAESEVKGQVNAFRECHKMFRDAHEKMQAFKESHDAIQCAQDAWHALAAARDDITAGKDVFTLKMASDLSEKCNYVRERIDNPVLAGEPCPRFADLPGAFLYRVTPVFMNFFDELSYGDFQEAAIELRRETYPEQLNVTFTRGFVVSQAFVDRYGGDDPDQALAALLPPKADQGLTFIPTHPRPPMPLTGWASKRARLFSTSSIKPSPIPWPRSASSPTI